MTNHSPNNVWDVPHLHKPFLKIAVLSDTHGNYPLAVRTLNRIPDLTGIIHLGDNIDDAFSIELATSRPVTKIAGNCDYAVVGPREMLLPLNGAKLLLTHGDRYNVKAGLDGLYRRAAEEGIGVVLYGHTHIPLIQNIGGIIFVNPGSLAIKARSPSIALIIVSGSSVKAEIFSADGC